RCPPRGRAQDVAAMDDPDGAPAVGRDRLRSARAPHADGRLASCGPRGAEGIARTLAQWNRGDDRGRWTVQRAAKAAIPDRRLCASHGPLRGQPAASDAVTAPARLTLRTYGLQVGIESNDMRVIDE